MDINEEDFIMFLTIKRGLSHNSVKLCKSKIKTLNKWLTVNNKELNVQSIESFLYQLKEKNKLKNNSINSYMFCLRFLKAYCVDRGTYNGFFEGFTNLPKNSTQIILVTLEEVERIWSHYHQYGSICYPVYVPKEIVTEHINRVYNTFTMFLLFTGARFSEGANLLVKHLTLDEDKGMALFLDTKNHESRTSIFFGELIDKLKILIEGKSPDDLVFTNVLGAKLQPQTYSNDLRNRARWVGVTKRVHPHLLRHCYGTMLYKSTRDIGLVQMALGHKDIKTTMKYINLAEDYMEEGIRQHIFFRKYIAAIEVVKQIMKRVEEFGLERDKRFDTTKVTVANFNFFSALTLAILPSA